MVFLCHTYLFFFLFGLLEVIGIIRRMALIKDLAAVYHAECLTHCQELLELQRKCEEVRHFTNCFLYTFDLLTLATLTSEHTHTCTCMHRHLIRLTEACLFPMEIWSLVHVLCTYYPESKH